MQPTASLELRSFIRFAKNCTNRVSRTGEERSNEDDRRVVSEDPRHTSGRSVPYIPSLLYERRLAGVVGTFLLHCIVLYIEKNWETTKMALCIPPLNAADENEGF